MQPVYTFYVSSLKVWHVVSSRGVPLASIITGAPKLVIKDRLETHKPNQNLLHEENKGLHREGLVPSIDDIQVHSQRRVYRYIAWCVYINNLSVIVLPWQMYSDENPLF